MSIMSLLKRKERDWEMNNKCVSDASDSQEEEEQEEPQIRNILIELSKKIPSQKAVDFLHSLATSKTFCFGLLKENGLPRPPNAGD